jgi:hypothetical protein
MKREDMSEDLINWLDWIQTRIPQLKRADRELWLVQALEGYKATKPKKKSLEERRFNFKMKCRGVNGLNSLEFGKDLINDFFEYWTEHNEGGSKMRFEMSKNQPFNIKRRLATWKRNQKTYNNGNKPTTTPNRNATEDDINNYINS